MSGRLSYENLVVTLTISNEAYTKAGATPAGYVDWVFEHVLGRPADPSGAAYWEARLESGTSRDRFVRSFLRSPERARAPRASRVPAATCGRAADSGGLTHWADQYTAAKVGELDLGGRPAGQQRVPWRRLRLRPQVLPAALPEQPPDRAGRQHRSPAGASR